MILHQNVNESVKNDMLDYHSLLELKHDFSVLEFKHDFTPKCKSVSEKRISCICGNIKEDDAISLLILLLEAVKVMVMSQVLNRDTFNNC